MLKKITVPPELKPIGPYSQAIKAQGLIFISGQLPIDPRTGKLIADNIKVATKQILDNISAILQADGSSLKDVIRVEIFLKNLNRDFAEMNEEYGKRFNSDAPPVRQTVEVSELPKGSPIEISCIAVASVP